MEGQIQSTNRRIQLKEVDLGMVADIFSGKMVEWGFRMVVAWTREKPCTGHLPKTSTGIARRGECWGL